MGLEPSIPTALPLLFAADPFVEAPPTASLLPFAIGWLLGTSSSSSLSEITLRLFDFPWKAGDSDKSLSSPLTSLGSSSSSFFRFLAEPFSVFCFLEKLAFEEAGDLEKNALMQHYKLAGFEST